MQIAFCSCGERLDFAPKLTMSVLSPDSACAAPGPWQASHCRPPGPKGARLSARLPCFVLKIAKTGYG
jgi:hypothetical protein